MTSVKILSLSAVLSLAGGAALAQLSSAEILSRLERQAETARSQSVESQSTSRGISVQYGDQSATGSARNVAARPAAPDESVSPATYAPPVVPEGDRVDLRITFETGSAFIRPGQAGLLNELCGALGAAPEDWVFNIIGHADAAGNDLYNLQLSEARAREVRRYLSSECGVAGERLQVYGLGETRPLPGVPSVSEQNRRVEVSINRS